MTDKIVITGASDGIGFELLKHYADQGHEVIGVGSRDEIGLPADWPRDAHYIRADLCDPQSSDSVLAAVKQLGWSHVDVLVLNAGYGMAIAPEFESVANIRKTLGVNLSSPITLSNAFYPLLAEASEKACLVLIGSVAHKGVAGFASYAASKAGVNGFARALRQEWQDKIDVVLIHPGPTSTRMHEKAGLTRNIAHNLFLSPTYSARKSASIIQNRKPQSTVSFGSRTADFFKSLIGLGVR